MSPCFVDEAKIEVVNPVNAKTFATPKKLKSNLKIKILSKPVNQSGLSCSQSTNSYYHNISLALQAVAQQESPKKPCFTKIEKKVDKSPKKESKTPLNQRDKISAGYFAPSIYSKSLIKLGVHNETASCSISNARNSVARTRISDVSPSNQTTSTKRFGTDEDRQDRTPEPGSYPRASVKLSTMLQTYSAHKEQKK